MRKKGRERVCDVTKSRAEIPGQPDVNIITRLMLNVINIQIVIKLIIDIFTIRYERST